MDERRQSLEALVGVLLILGLCAIGFLFVKFGKLGGNQEHYSLMVEMSDATGIREEVPVRLGGVLIGQVAGPPQLKADYSALVVPLEIYQQIRIPGNSLVTVGSAGLMGDNYVKFTLPANPSREFIAPGTTLRAGSAVGLKALQSDAEGVMNNVNVTVSDLNRAISSLERVFTKVEKMLDTNDSGNLQDAIADLSEMAKNVKAASQRLDPLLGTADQAIKDFGETAATIKQTSDKLDPLVVSADETISEIKAAASDAREAIGTAGETFETGSEAMKDIASAVNKAEPTLEEIAAVLGSFRKTLEQIEQFAEATENSNGLIKALWDDPEFKKDFIDLVDKLENHGIIFYPKEKKQERSPLFNGQGSRRR